jgi:hypothetical protein
VTFMAQDEGGISDEEFRHTRRYCRYININVGGPQEGDRVHNGFAKRSKIFTKEMLAFMAKAVRQSHTEADQEWDLLRVVVAHKGANQLAQVHGYLKYAPGVAASSHYRLHDPTVIEIHHKTGHLQMLGNGIYVSTSMVVTDWVPAYRIAACNLWSYGGMSLD